MKISIVVPVYNTEIYIEQCINSIINQNYKNLEIIIINDGSTDSSYEILKNQYKQHPNIKIITINNKGVSYARNIGIQIASGDYITFIDSDDYIKTKFLKNLTRPLLQFKYDWIISGINDFTDNTILKKSILPKKKWLLLNAQQYIEFLQVELLSSPVSKLYKTEIIKTNNIRFNNSISYAEDREFNLQYIQHINNAYTINNSDYYYRKNVISSLSNQKYDYKFTNEYKHWDIKRNFLYTKFSNEIEYINSKITNELFNIINDKIVSDSKELSIITFFFKSKKKFTPINFSFLKSNKKYIDSTYWQSSLLVNKFLLFLFMIYKVRHLIYGKTN